MKHIVEFNSGFDCSKFQCIADDARCKPGSPMYHGKSGLTIRFVVKGTHGAVQFLLNTDIFPQHKKPSPIGVRHCEYGNGGIFPMDMGYHSKEPRYKGQEQSQESCEYCDGLPCYYDGSGLNAYDAMYALANGGDRALWEFLEAYYAVVFLGRGKYPSPAEFIKPPRTR